MEKGPFHGPKADVEEVPNGLTDMEIALFYAMHLDHPCEVEVAPGKVENIRYLYLREAKGALERFANEHAKRFLESKIKEYETERGVAPDG